MLLFLIPQAFPNLTVYMNVARLFYQWGLNGSIAGWCWCIASTV
nr:Uncharacterised protein [Klebsiella pneumoniae]